MRKWFASLYDHGTDLQERLFKLIAVFGISALVVMFVLSIIMGESAEDILLLLLGLVLFAAIVGLSVRFHRIQAGACLISAILTFVMLPFIFVSSGGMYGGTPMWFLFGAVFVSLVVRGWARGFFLVGCGVVLTGCYLIQWYFPERITPHTAKMAYTDSLASTLIVGVFVSLMVIFESKIYLEERRIAEERRREIEEINRAQNSFFSNMSHEIRTPVNTIIGLNEMIMREAVTAEVAEDARSIQGAGQMLLALINDVLDMSKIESGKMELVTGDYDVGELLSDIVNMIWSRAKEKGLDFHVEVDETTPKRLVGDDVRIKQILINLLNNAVKYTREGSVTLSVECRRPKSPDEGQAELVFTVTDTGMGIKKESLPMLFDVFRRVDESRNRYIEGTGLGLSIVKQLVDLMGGEITVDSVYTRGSTFRVRLPQTIADPVAIGKLTLKSGRSLRGREAYRQSFEAPEAAVLIVDDNELNANVAAKLLAPTKMRIDAVYSGKECLERSLKTHYNVILMDHLMPEMDGITALSAIRAQKGGMNRNTPVVVLTANAGSENQALYRRSGFDGYLLKPVTGAQLEDTVREHLPRHLVSATGISTVQADEGRVVDAHTRKAPIAVTADSDCDLPPQLLGMYRIRILPYRIRTAEGEFTDGVDLSTGEALGYAARNAERGTITAIEPSVEDYEEFFAQCLSGAEHVFHITTSAGGKSAYRSAGEAAAAFGNVTVFDSGQLSGGMGMLAIYAARIAETESIDAKGLLETMEGIKPRVKTAFVADDTTALLKNGLITPAVDALCRSFMFRPMLVPSADSLKLKRVLGGPRQQYLSRFVAGCLRGADIDRSRLFVIAPAPSPEDNGRITDILNRTRPFEDVRFFQASAATSLSWGAGMIELVYMTKRGQSV